MIKINEYSVSGLEIVLRDFPGTWVCSQDYPDICRYGCTKDCEYWLYAIDDESIERVREMLENGSIIDSNLIVTMNIEAPIYWWIEAGKYGMILNNIDYDKIVNRNITRENFSFSDSLIDDDFSKYLDDTISILNKYRLQYINSGYSNGKDLDRLINLLMSGFVITSTVHVGYDRLSNIYSMVHDKDNRVILSEWKSFCNFLEELPYFTELYF